VDGERFHDRRVFRHPGRDEATYPLAGRGSIGILGAVHRKKRGTASNSG
jgi:hypothetical protein